ncbi:MAG: sensor histidine kinase, partial [Ruminiclostridium sp.]
NNILNYMESFPFVSSVYIFDKYGNEFGLFGNQVFVTSDKKLFDMPWYLDLLKSKGGYIIRTNTQKLLKNESENKISFMRIINDLETQKMIGAIVINIPETLFLNNTDSVIKQYEVDTILLDENNNRVAGGLDIRLLNKEIINYPVESEYTSLIQEIRGDKYIITMSTLGELNWKIINMQPVKDLKKELNSFMRITIIIGCAFILLFILVSFFISTSITKPIYKLIKSMSGIKYRRFEAVTIKTGNDEIGQLKENYNLMINEIQQLIKKVIDEQQTTRKAELSVLYEQIKPHFLYNTLDTIGYMALTEERGKVYDAIENLGSYYKNSLSSGSEMVTIENEINIVKDYLALQKLRYGGLFEDSYNIDSGIKDIQVLKLILQPLVENALYHGIKPLAVGGNIDIVVKRSEENLVFIIKDNGVGMSPEKIAEILDNSQENKRSNFGLRGTLERIRIFYSIKNFANIDSRINKGTTITITIPLMQ